MECGDVMKCSDAKHYGDAIEYNDAMDCNNMIGEGVQTQKRNKMLNHFSVYIFYISAFDMPSSVLIVGRRCYMEDGSI